MEQKRLVVILVIAFIIISTIGYFYLPSSPYFSPRVVTPSTISVNNCIALATQCISSAGECGACTAQKTKCDELEYSGATELETANCYVEADKLCENNPCAKEKSACAQFEKECVSRLKFISNRII